MPKKRDEEVDYEDLEIGGGALASDEIDVPGMEGFVPPSEADEEDLDEERGDGDADEQDVDDEEDEDGDGDEVSGEYDGDEEEEDDEDDEDEAERKRARNRRRRQRARRSKREIEEAKNEQIEDLRRRLASTEEALTRIADGNSASAMQRLDQAISTAEHNMQVARARRKQAMEDQEPEAFDQADLELAEHQRAYEHFRAQKVAIVENQRNRKAAGSIKPEQARRTQSFLDKHKWFKPGAGDFDSDVTQMLDNQVANEGYDPSTPAYWNELERRIRERLPHRFEEEDRKGRRSGQRPARKGAPISGGGRDGGRKPAGEARRGMPPREVVAQWKSAGHWPTDNSEESKAKRERMTASWRRTQRSSR